MQIARFPVVVEYPVKEYIPSFPPSPFPFNRAVLPLQSESPSISPLQQNLILPILPSFPFPFPFPLPYLQGQPKLSLVETPVTGFTPSARLHICRTS